MVVLRKTCEISLASSQDPRRFVDKYKIPSLSLIIIATQSAQNLK